MIEYTPTIWIDRIVEKPLTYSVTENTDGTITLTPVPGTVTAEGTKVNANRLNNIESGIVKCVDGINKLNEIRVVTDDALIKNDTDNTIYDTLLETGTYYLTNNNAFMLVINYNDTLILQIIFANEGSIFIRKFSDNAWSSYWNNFIGGVG